MFGCFIKVINIVIVMLAIIGLIALGGTKMVKNFFHAHFPSSPEGKIEKAMPIGDFSKLDKEFCIISSSQLPKIGNYIWLEHASSTQMFLMTKPSKTSVLTKTDFETEEADKKIMKFVSHYKISENFEITGRGSMHAFEQTVPFVKYKAKIEKFPMHMRGTEGIVGVALKDNENVIIVVANEKGKYSQIVTDALFNKIK